MKTSADFGHIAEGTLAEKTVTLRNNGAVPLEVANVESSCGCTTTQAPKSIPAGGEASLQVHFDARGKEGKIAQWVALHFRSNKVPLLQIPVTGLVTREISLSKPSLDLGSVPSASPSTLTVTRLDGKPLTIVAVDAPASLKVRSSTSDAANIGALSVAIVERGLPGEHDEKVTLRLDHPLQPHVTVPVSWITPSLYRVEPATVNFGIVAPSSTLAKTVHLSGSRFVRPRIASQPEGWNASITPTGVNTAVLTLKGILKGGLLNSKVMVETGNPAQQQIAVPIFAATDAAADEACRAKP